MRATWAWTGLTLVGIAAGSYGLYVWLQPKQLPQQVIYGNGRVEGTDIRVASEVAGRVVENKIIEGQPVQRGGLLLRVDESEYKLQLARAKAEVASLGNQREASKAELEFWRHHAKVAETNLGRYRQLEESGAATPQRFEEAENTARESAGRVASLEAQIASLEARKIAAQREHDIVALKLEKTRVVAPVSATVLVKAAEVGEFLQPGSPVAVLVDLSRITLKIYVPEAEIGKVKLGAAARVRVDAFPERLFDAQVDRVDQQAQFTPRDIHMPEERTRMVFGITLAVDNPDGLLKPGMPADAWILWQPGAGWPQSLHVPG